MQDYLEGIAEHITAARASGDAADEADVRTVLDRLGEPEEIVAAAHKDVPPGSGPPPVAQPRGTGHELAAVLLLTAGSLVPVVGWLAGGVLLGTSSLWRGREKVLGTLVVPLGPGVVLFGLPVLTGLYLGSETCTTTGGVGTELLAPLPKPPTADVAVTTCEVTGLSAWFAIPLTLLLVVAPVVVAVVLYRIVRRRATQALPTIGPRSGAGPSPWGPLEVAAVVLLGVGGLVVPFVGAVVGLVLPAPRRAGPCATRSSPRRWRWYRRSSP